MELTVKDLQRLQSAHPDYRDVSFVRAERLRQSPRSFAELAPDLMVEVKSPTDSLKKIRQKITNFLVLGTQVGILIDPETRTVEVYRPAVATAEILKDGDQLTLPELLPDWTLAITKLWPLVF